MFYGAVMLRDRSPFQSSGRTVRTFIDYADPQERVSQRIAWGRILRYFAFFLAEAIGAGELPLGFFGVFPMAPKSTERR